MSRFIKTLSLLLSIIILAGCAESELKQEGKQQYEWNGKTISIASHPERISAFSLDATEVLLSLVEPERVAVVSSSIDNENMSHYSHLAEQFDIKVSGSSIDPEQVIAYDTDLVLITMTHEAEQDATELLAQAGIPLVAFEDWNTVEGLQNNLQFIGEITGTQQRAAELIDEIDRAVDEIQTIVKEAERKPVVLALSQVYSNSGPYALGPSSIAYDIIRLAGATSATDLLGLERTAPISLEHIIQVDPDYIILVEWAETSEAFDEMVQSAGFQTLKAVESNRVKSMKAKDIQITNPQVVLNGLKEVSAWIHPELFSQQKE